MINVERLFDKIIGTLLDRCDRDFDIAVTRNDDNWDIRVVTFDSFQDVDAVHPAVFKPDIEDHQTGGRRVDFRHAIV
ncbi:MAG: hypothetical protein ACD_10C00806G0001 [uncultured bacterium]|nr:MAG: hypothetical protein ACD_10C00806G0001 [uncultured bacterium]